jgi:Protein of unknown function (DUF3105)
MTKKKRKPRNRQTASRPSPPQGATDSQTAPRAAPARGGADPARKARKEAARKAREAARKKQTRVSFARRSMVIGVVTLVAIGTLYYLERAASPRPVSAEAITAAADAKCSTVQIPSGNPTGGHLSPGQQYTYSQHPATSGLHDPTPLSTDPGYTEVYTEPVIETQAVHFLEHAGVMIYYRQTGDGALPQDVVDAMASVAHAQRNTIMAPYPDLPGGTSLAFAAWNRLQTCPSTVTADQATTIANGFVIAFVCTALAPEPKNSPDC